MAHLSIKLPYWNSNSNVIQESQGDSDKSWFILKHSRPKLFGKWKLNVMWVQKNWLKHGLSNMPVDITKFTGQQAYLWGNSINICSRAEILLYRKRLFDIWYLNCQTAKRSLFVFSLMALEKVAAIDTFFNPKQKGCYYANMFHLTDHPITNILVKT